MKKIITVSLAIIASLLIVLPIVPPNKALAAANETVKTVAPLRVAGVTSGITKTQALDIALKDAGYETDDTLYTKVKKDRDDGMEVYDVEFRVGFVIYQYEIDVASGQIIDFEIDD